MDALVLSSPTDTVRELNTNPQADDLVYLFLHSPETKCFQVFPGRSKIWRRCQGMDTLKPFWRVGGEFLGGRSLSVLLILETSSV